jgi:hypothetical protein
MSFLLSLLNLLGQLLTFMLKREMNGKREKKKDRGSKFIGGIKTLFTRLPRSQDDRVFV